MKKIKKSNIRETLTYTLDEIDEVKFLVFVIKLEYEKSIIDRIPVLGGRVVLSTRGEGISKNRKMEMLGINPTINAVIFAQARSEDANNILVALDAEFHFSEEGNGLGFVIDVDGYMGAKGMFID